MEGCDTLVAADGNNIPVIWTINKYPAVCMPIKPSRSNNGPANRTPRQQYNGTWTLLVDMLRTWSGQMFRNIKVLSSRSSRSPNAKRALKGTS